MNKKALKSVMALHGDTNRDLAQLLGKTVQSVSAKINENGSEFTQGEIVRIKDRYNLSAEQIETIFFSPKVS